MYVLGVDPDWKFHLIASKSVREALPDALYVASRHATNGIELATRDRPDILISRMYDEGAQGMALAFELRDTPGLRNMRIVLTGERLRLEDLSVVGALGSDRVFFCQSTKKEIGSVLKSLL